MMGVESPTSSVDKAASLLLAFSRVGGCGTLTELAHETELPKSTAHRLLNALRAAGLVDRSEMDWYLRRPLMRLGALALRGGPGTLREVALPYMTELYEETHENVHMAVLEEGAVLYLDKVYGHHSTASPSRVGHRVPAHVCALGKAMLAFADDATVRSVIAGGLRPETPRSVVAPGVLLRQLRAARTDELAFDREESRQGLVCVAAPILSPAGHAVAAISVAGSAHTMRLETVGLKVRAAARQISLKIGPDAELLATAV